MENEKKKLDMIPEEDGGMDNIEIPDEVLKEVAEAEGVEDTEESQEADPRNLGPQEIREIPVKPAVEERKRRSLGDQLKVPLSVGVLSGSIALAGWLASPTVEFPTQIQESSELVNILHDKIEDLEEKFQALSDLNNSLSEVVADNDADNINEQQELATKLKDLENKIKTLKGKVVNGTDGEELDKLVGAVDNALNELNGDIETLAEATEKALQELNNSLDAATLKLNGKISELVNNLKEIIEDIKEDLNKQDDDLDKLQTNVESRFKTLMEELDKALESKKPAGDVDGSIRNITTNLNDLTDKVDTLTGQINSLQNRILQPVDILVDTSFISPLPAPKLEGYDQLLEHINNANERNEALRKGEKARWDKLLSAIEEAGSDSSKLAEGLRKWAENYSHETCDEAVAFSVYGDKEADDRTNL